MKKTNNEKIYNKLKKQGLTDREIAESFIFPSELTAEEKVQSDKELTEMINNIRNEKDRKEKYLT